MLRLKEKMKKTLGLSDDMGVVFRESTEYGFTFTISGTPKQIYEVEEYIKSKDILVSITGKSDIDEEDPNFQCLYCEFKNTERI